MLVQKSFWIRQIIIFETPEPPSPPPPSHISLPGWCTITIICLDWWFRIKKDSIGLTSLRKIPINRWFCITRFRSPVLLKRIFPYSVIVAIQADNNNNNNNRNGNNIDKPIQVFIIVSLYISNQLRMYPLPFRILTQPTFCFSNSSLGISQLDFYSIKILKCSKVSSVRSLVLYIHITYILCF